MDWLKCWLSVHVQYFPQQCLSFPIISLLYQRNVKRDQRNQRYPAGGMQSLSKNQNRQKFSRKMQRNYGRGQWHDRKPIVSALWFLLLIILQGVLIARSLLLHVVAKVILDSKMYAILKQQPPFGLKIIMLADLFHGNYLFWEANIFLKAYLEENCELQGTDNGQGQLSKRNYSRSKWRLLCLLSFRSFLQHVQS